ncbi:DinB family protein [Cellulomonas cellasea]|uniref:DinB family protein n=1 Tax=Cellulomonas cellasea TaxID=43670 RepID=UPI0025A3D258|nr:DinB family protein [Cellulomonas cellasea]MDM8085880.1 DinB family protein [Cellulomonas cellasea]
MTSPVPEVPQAAPPIVPDTKDWTAVLGVGCEECGFRPDEVPPAALGGAVRDMAPRWVAALHRPDVQVRPDPTTWSVLEYGAHVRDVHLLFAERLRRILTEDDPLFDNWDQDATAVEQRYDLQDPAVVADELADAAEAFAALLDGVREADLDRPGLRSNGSAFTVRTLEQYFLHDVVHHLHDVRG